MAWTTIRVGETPEALSARLRRPVCMLLRANRLYSTAWLLPGRALLIPPPDFCDSDVGVCPVRMGGVRAERFVAGEATNLPKRLLCWARVHGQQVLPEWMGAPEGCALTMRPFESVAQLAERGGSNEATLRRWNRYFGAACPGVRLFVPARRGQR